MRPTPGHIPTSRYCRLYGMPSLCWCASATQEWFRAFPVIPSRHAVLSDPGEFIGCTCPVPSPMTWAFAKGRPARHSGYTHHPLQTSGSFRGSIGSLSLRPVKLLAPLADRTRRSAQPTGAFTPELSTRRSPSSPSGITTVVTEHLHRWDFHPLERQLESLIETFLRHLGQVFMRRDLPCRTRC